MLKSVGTEIERGERDVTAVHALQAHAGGVDLDVGLRHEILDGIHHLFQHRPRDEFAFKHDDRVFVSRECG